MIIAKQPPSLESPKALLQVTRHLGIAPQHKILRTVSTRNFIGQDELDKARLAWTKFESSRRRCAIYPYLSEVFAAVRRWKQQNCVDTKVHQALKSTGHRNAIRKHEPFSVAIFCSSDPRKVDAKTRSKWSRALRFTEQFKPEAVSVAKFIQSRGGINELLQ
jgi:hypothetical protein